MKTYKKHLIPIWIVLFVVYLFILFIYQISLSQKPTIIFTVTHICTSTMISLFVIGVKSDNKKLTNFISILAITILFICSIGVAGYFNHHKHDDFQKKEILLTGASGAFQSLNIKSENIVSVDVGEFTEHAKTDGFPYRYKVKVVSSDSEKPYYFECSDSKCETMVRYSYPVED
ncbi:hypothetical protein ACIQXF_02525 [Lysinibacillus sp. NPDC097231]|uniref:hypothetical protein n=1 Tax=Lysinibacillus sp. NPDC097231 TaxID=3364142 RepID=UPI0037FDD85C